MINYNGRASELGGTVVSTLLTDDGQVYHALSVHLSLAKLTTRFDDRYAVTKFFKSRVFEQSSSGMYPLFLEIPKFSYDTV